MSLFAVALVLLSRTHIGTQVAPLLFATVPPAHLYLQVRDTYGLGNTVSAVAYTLALLGILSTVLGLFVLFILAVGLG
jgi:hypothetical protein